jgi:hypothetical protein
MELWAHQARQSNPISRSGVPKYDYRAWRTQMASVAPPALPICSARPRASSTMVFALGTASTAERLSVRNDGPFPFAL